DHVIPLRSKGSDGYWHYSFFKNVFATHFKWFPCGAAGRDLSATGTAVFQKGLCCTLRTVISLRPF
ncbi:MAG: hypothetical protein ABR597_02315, partial [Bacteroidales bacterium]